MRLLITLTLLSAHTRDERKGNKGEREKCSLTKNVHLSFSMAKPNDPESRALLCPPHHIPRRRERTFITRDHWHDYSMVLKAFGKDGLQ